MRFTICVLAILFPSLGYSQLAGDWAGVVKDAQGVHRVVLHISGPFSEMKASADISGQKFSKVAVDSITFSGSTLDFSISAADAQYSGVLNDSGDIFGTFTQHGVGVSLVLSRSARVYPPDVQTEGSAEVENRHYVHKPSGVEFDLPAGWSLDRTQFSNGDRGESTIINDPSGKATAIAVNILKRQMDPNVISTALTGRLTNLVSMRAGNGPPRQAAPNYKIREGSVQQMSIGGHQALRAIGEFTRGDKDYAELLAWIITDNTSTYFFLRSFANDLPGQQPLFDQWTAIGEDSITLFERLFIRVIHQRNGARPGCR
jgi:hypothetical protein